MIFCWYEDWILIKIKAIMKKKGNKTICVQKTELTACSMDVACLHKKTNTNFGWQCKQSKQTKSFSWIPCLHCAALHICNKPLETNNCCWMLRFCLFIIGKLETVYTINEFANELHQSVEESKYVHCIVKNSKWQGYKTWDLEKWIILGNFPF